MEQGRLVEEARAGNVRRRRTERRKKANRCGRSERGEDMFWVAVREDLVEKGDGI